MPSRQKIFRAALITIAVLIATSAALPALAGAPSGNRLVIPAIGVDAPLVEARIVNRTWQVNHLINTVGHFVGTAYPGGATGNVVLGSHFELAGRAPGVFYRLPELNPGDLVQVVYNGATYNYVVERSFLVSPNQVDVVYPTADPILTLLTCAGYDAATDTYPDRLVVVARPA